MNAWAEGKWEGVGGLSLLPTSLGSPLVIKRNFWVVKNYGDIHDKRLNSTKHILVRNFARYSKKLKLPKPSLTYILRQINLLHFEAINIVSWVKQLFMCILNAHKRLPVFKETSCLSANSDKQNYRKRKCVSTF